MLHKTFKRKRAVWVAAVVLPLLAVLVYSLSSKVYAKVEKSGSPNSAITDTLPEKPPPPPPFSKVAQDYLDKYPVIYEFINTKENTTRVKGADEFKAIKRPIGVKNIIFKVSDYFVKQAIMVYRDNTRIIEDLSTPEARQEFNRKYEMKIGFKVIPKGEEQKFLQMSAEQRKKATPLPPPSPKVELIKYLPPNVKTINVKTNNGLKTAEIIYKDGRKVSGDISTSDKEKEFEKKYGVVLPPPPPPPPPARQEGATDKEIAEYGAILKEMRIERENGRKSYKFIEGKTQRAVEIHKKMTEQQRAEVEMLPPPPPPPVSSNLSQNGITQKEIKEFEKLIKESVVVVDGIKRYKNGMYVPNFLYLYNKMTDKQRANYKNLLPM